MSEQDEAHKKQLIERYLSGRATEQELMAFFGLINQKQLEDLIEAYMDADIRWLTEENTAQSRRGSIWPKIVAAIAVFAFLTIGAYIFLNRPKTNEQLAQLPQKERFKDDVRPNTKNAILTLSNGQTIVLNTAANGVLASQGSTQISKNNSGDIVYAGNNNPAAQLTYNTVTIPRGGGKQSLVLPDGSKVWLNAGSSITYPVAFNAKERKIKLNGEAYFSVIHNAKVKFIVQTERGDIEDIGTEFNVMAYANESVVKTTLLQGSVNILAGNSNKILVPGQQAQVFSLNQPIRVINNADTEGATAWKNGEFQFNNDDLKNILRQMERWYDVDVDYSKVPETHFNGAISRNSTLSEVLKMLEQTGNIKFAIEGKNLKVLID